MSRPKSRLLSVSIQRTEINWSRCGSVYRVIHLSPPLPPPAGTSFRVLALQGSGRGLEWGQDELTKAAVVSAGGVNQEISCTV